VDALYILLGGTMTVSISEDNRNPLARAFALEAVRKKAVAETVSGRNRGKPFIDVRLPSATVKALEDSCCVPGSN